MSTSSIDHPERVLVDPLAYADEPRLHTALARLRKDEPVPYVDDPKYRPFFAITKHADVLDVERANDLWISAPRIVLMTAERDSIEDAQRAAGAGFRPLISMDNPDHRVMRAIGADWFRPKALRALDERIRDLAKRYVDKMRDAGPECDFVQEVAVNYPLYVILSLLGLPESDFPRMLKLTQELFGSDDDEMRRGADPHEIEAVQLDFYNYFTALTAARREAPTDDLASAIANALVDGEPLSDVDTVSYYVLIATAGHDTTSATIAGGLQALIENPEQMQLLKQKPEVMGTAIEEMIRWVTPVKCFLRTAASDTTVRGVPVREGQAVLLSYVSANRDEDVFEEPFTFDITRDPNRHAAFGYGVHFCLGATLARMELTSFFNELIPRLDHIELAGEPKHMATTFVGGLKHLPIRYKLR
jgi:cytochrome P450